MTERIETNPPIVDPEEIRTGRIKTINISEDRLALYQRAAKESGFGFSIIAWPDDVYPTAGFNRYSHQWDSEKEHLSI